MIISVYIYIYMLYGVCVCDIFSSGPTGCMTKISAARTRLGGFNPLVESLLVSMGIPGLVK